MSTKKFSSTHKSYQHNKDLTVVNILGGPGTGKSLLAHTLYVNINTDRRLTCEYVSEFAKDCVWDQQFVSILEQDVITCGHNRKLRSLVNSNVNLAITDTSLLLGLIYLDDHVGFPQSFRQVIIDMFQSYNNYVIFLERSPLIPYQTQGRQQTAEQAEKKDEEVKAMLQRLNVPYRTIVSGEWDVDELSRDIVNNVLKTVDN